MLPGVYVKNAVKRREILNRMLPEGLDLPTIYSRGNGLSVMPRSAGGQGNGRPDARARPGVRVTASSLPFAGSPAGPENLADRLSRPPLALW